jgi:hypothetical protein
MPNFPLDCCIYVGGIKIDHDYDAPCSPNVQLTGGGGLL